MPPTPAQGCSAGRRRGARAPRLAAAAASLAPAALAVALVVALTATLALATAAPPPGEVLTVRMTAPWPESPRWVAMHTIEHLFESKDEDGLWRALLQPAPGGAAPGNATTGDRLLRVLLHTRAYAAAIESHRSVAVELRRRLPFRAPAEAGGCGSAAFAAVSTLPNHRPFATCNVEDLAKAQEEDVAECAAPAAAAAAGSAPAPASARLVLLPGQDIVHPDSSDAPDRRLIVVHGEPGTFKFQALLAEAVRLLKLEPNLAVAVRLVPDPATARPRTNLGGFAVALDVKNTEYISVNRDDARKDAAATAATSSSSSSAEHVVAGIDFDKLAKRGDAAGKEDRLEVLKSTLKSEANKLKAWEMRDLGLQAAVDVLTPREGVSPLERLEAVSHALPAHARRLSGLLPPDDEVESWVANRLWSPTAPALGRLVNKLFLNGVEAPVSLVALLDTARRVAALADKVSGAGLSKAAFDALLQGASKKREGLVPSDPPRVDVRRKARGAVVFANDLEKDERYHGWPSALKTLTQPTAQVHSIRRNLYTAIFVLDPVDPSAAARSRVASVVQVARYFLQVRAPIKFGFVVSSAALAERFADWGEDTPEKDAALPRCASEADPCGGECAARLFAAARKQHGVDAAMVALLALASATPAGGEGAGARDGLDSARDGAISCGGAVAAVADALAEVTGAWSVSGVRKPLWAAVNAPSGAELDETVRKMARYAGALDLPVPSVAFNGIVAPLSESDRADMVLSRLLFAEQARLGAAVGRGALNENEDVLTQILSLTEARPFNSPLVNGLMAKSSFVALPRSLPIAASAPTSSGAGAGVAAAAWGSLASSTVTVVVPLFRLDADDCRAASLALSVDSAALRVVVLAATPAAVLTGREFWRELKAAGASGARAEALAVVQARCSAASGAGAPPPGSGAEPEEGLVDASFRRTLAAVRASVGGSPFLVANGRVVKISASTKPRDVDAVVAMEASLVGSRQLVRLLQGESAPEAAAEGGVDADFVAAASSVLGLRESVSAAGGAGAASLEALAEWPRELTAPVLEGDASLDVVLVANPLDPWTQKASSAALLLHRALGARVRLFLAPRHEVAELPPSSFFGVSFAGAGAAGAGAEYEEAPTIRFRADEVALKQILTMKISVPSSWIAYPGDMGGADPDNLILEEGKPAVSAEYQLAHVLVEGHASVRGTMQPAAGMQLAIVRHDGLDHDTESGDAGGDDAAEEGVEGAGGAEGQAPETTAGSAVKSTVVMHNLGYWQIKASPGAWRVKPVGKTPFALADPALGGLGGGEGAHAFNSRVVLSRAFETPALDMEVWPLDGAAALVHRRRAGAAQSGKAVKPAAAGGGGAGSQETIHVFSLASGALYERFLRIMMLSVRKRTTGPVKFWLLENYMSAPMKRFVRRFAREYGFEVDLVTFKWPEEWLRPQTERQRQIWGYKILFLDVLFPLDVKKIIYVDSDQVLRADLRELWDLDLEGKPYAFTPFCDSRKETLGFQFWRSGYWKGHLGEKPYHISALFVADLDAFRGQLIGDKLRATYQQLSADPNSLSNLDQDLPNYAQHEVPIRSLPQEWLWCESWCDDASKARAKTIDLCNNPLHKEPKLEMAKRVIQGPLFPESWIELDEEVKRLWDRVQRE